MSKLSDFLSKSKIDSRRLLAASKGIESFGREDRAIVLARRTAKSASATDAIKEVAKTKKRSGRPVGAPTLNAALRGEKISQPARQRITRAVNQVLTQKKRDAVTSKDLF